MLLTVTCSDIQKQVNNTVTKLGMWRGAQRSVGWGGCVCGVGVGGGGGSSDLSVLEINFLTFSGSAQPL